MLIKPLPYFSLIFGCLLLCLNAGATAAASGRNAQAQFGLGEACYVELRAAETRQQHRINWITCISRFEDAYRQDPFGARADASLFMAARLYAELHARSGLAADRREALDYYERLMRRFPTSTYRARAEAARKELISQPSVLALAPPVPASTAPSTSDARTRFENGRQCYMELERNPARIQKRQNWLSCIDAFEKAHALDPSGPWAAAALFMVAELHRQLYGYSGNMADLQTARTHFEEIVENYPSSRYHSRAAETLVRLSAQPATTPETVAPPREMGPDVSVATATTSNPAVVTSLRYWSNPSYTRVVVDLDRETSFSHHLLQQDLRLGKPQRLYVDLAHSRVGKQLQRQIPIDDDLLLDARAGQFTPDRVRVVVDIKSFNNYKIFSLTNPFRLVIDVWGEKAQPAPAPEPARPVQDPGRLEPGALARQLALGVNRIVIDPGHGGRDFGAPGYLKGVHEKDIVLAIALKVAERLRRELKVEVIMTRTNDRFLSLEERTAIANTRNADLFVSIHTNAHRNSQAHGIETYFLNLATDEESIRVAARENAISTRNISDLQNILTDLMKNAKINESARLAGYVQSNLVQHLKSNFSQIQDKGVKQAPFYVLLGAQMPSVLIETSFISNPRECKRLIDPAYQDHLARGIVNGIRHYIQETAPTVRFGDSSARASTGGCPYS